MADQRREGQRHDTAINVASELVEVPPGYTALLDTQSTSLLAEHASHNNRWMNAGYAFVRPPKS